MLLFGLRGVHSIYKRWRQTDSWKTGGMKIMHFSWKLVEEKLGGSKYIPPNHASGTYV